MSEQKKRPSEDPPKKKRPGRPKKRVVDMPDDEAIQKIFPKRVVNKINKNIDYEPKKHD